MMNNNNTSDSVDKLLIKVDEGVFKFIKLIVKKDILRYIAKLIIIFVIAIVVLSLFHILF